MAIPIQVQLFDAFLGTQEGIHSIILPDIFSSGGSQNVYIDKFGRVARINGYTKQNSSAYTTNSGASAAMVRALIPYRATAGGSITRKLLFVLDDQVNEWEIWVSTDNGVTGTFLYDGGASAVGQVPDAAQFGDTLYVTSGKAVPRKYDGTTMSAAGLTQSPTPTSALSANSGNLKGDYEYKLVSTIDGVRQNGSASSTSLLVVDKQVDLSWTADADTNVDGYEIYRTTGTGTTFYYLTTISGRTTVAYTDNVSDTALLENRVLEEHGDAPPQAYFCEPHKQRMWWLRTDANPTRGYWSDPGAPESVYAQNFLDFSDSETIGDQITGGFGNYEGMFVVFTEKAIWTVSGDGAIIGDIPNWTKTRTNAQTGSVTHRSAVRVPAGARYTDQLGQAQTTRVAAISYFSPLGDIRIFDGDNDLIISHPVRDTVNAFNYTHRTKIFAYEDPDLQQVTWFFPGSTSATEPDTAVTWNYRYGVWYKWTPMPFGHVVGFDKSDDSHAAFAGEATTSKGAFIYNFFTGDSFDGSAIDARWMTKTLYGVNKEGLPALSNRKRWRWVDLLFKTETGTNIDVSWFNGVAPDTADPIRTITATPTATSLLTASGSTIQTADSSEIRLGAASAQIVTQLHTTSGNFLHDEGMRLRFRTNGTGGGWALEAMQIAYQLLPGLRRRHQV